ncbi:hypothetical protein LAZ67_17002338 [Cordylochernes scorpioides]|uniref:Retrotransposon gag domain-containing protein n=1 Tax=Cordylochernes scorpioides TaxID=51811 RepID=A0ABY6LGJ5_9ARAC|nr:hypothetical protein LAZ67_17002338 [Cordylochernes scorpioides]
MFLFWDIDMCRGSIFKFCQKIQKASTRSSIISFEPYILKEEPFENYIQRFKQYIFVNEIEGKKIVPFFIMSVGANTYSILKELIAPRDVCALEFEEIVSVLIVHFTPKLNIIFERYEFSQLFQEHGEKIEYYVLKLKKQANRCNFGLNFGELLRELKYLLQIFFQDFQIPKKGRRKRKWEKYY